MSKKKKSLKEGWKIIFKYLLEFKKDIIVLSIIGVISAIATASIPYITGLFFDSILDKQYPTIEGMFGIPAWLFFIIVFGLVQLIASTFNFINSKKGSEISLLLYSTYNARSIEHLLKLPISFHKTEKVGAIQEKINTAAMHIEQIVRGVIIGLTPHFLSILIGLAIAYFISPLLTLILIIGVVLFVLTIYRVMNPIVTITEKARRMWNKAFGDSYDVVANVHTVKKFNTEEYESKKIYNKFIDKAAMSWHKVNIAWSKISFYQEIIVAITRVVVFLVSVQLVVNGNISIGELIALNAYAMMVFGPFTSLSYSWQSLQSGLVTIAETEKTLNIPQEKYKPEKEIKLKEIKGDVEFKNMSFHYNDKEGDVLQSISVKVHPGETIALVGESGSGKSTFSELISAYYFGQKGEVLIDGVNIKNMNLNFLRKNIAVVPQEVTLFNDTVKTNIKYGNFNASDEELEEASRKAHAHTFISRFPKKYKQIVGERGIKLSVGQKQRIAIARAFLRNPKILILDEPTSALDLKSEKLISASLKELMKDKTTFIIAHRLSTVRHADRILVFKDGKIVEEGKHKDLIKIKNGVYKELYDLHIGLE